MITLDINGSFDMTIFKEVEGKKVEVSKSEVAEILAKLKSSEYVFGFETRTIKTLSDFKTVYTVELTINDDTEYNFSKAE